jgi:hypothetical protein
MNDFKGFDWNDPGLRAPSPEERQSRAALSPQPSESAQPARPAPAVESPLPAKPPLPAGSALPVGPALPAGPGSANPPRTVEGDSLRLAPPQQTLSASSASRGLSPSTFQRAVSVFRAALPLVQRVLPLLDGNVGTAVSNLMAPRPQTTPPPPPVNLAPIESGLAKLQLQHRELRDQVAEQNTSLKKVEDQLQHVREATDRNTLEQQELLQDLKTVGVKVNIFAYIALALLGLSVVLNIVLYVHLRHILR